MNAMKTIGLSGALLLATGVANAAVYNLGDITNSISKGYSFVDIYSYTTSGFLTDTFTFSVAEESRLSASVFSSGSINDVVSFSLIQLEGFNGEVTSYFGGLASTAILNDVTAGAQVALAAGSYSLQLEGSFLASSTVPTYIYNITASSIAAPVPEPSSIALMLGGLGLVGFMAARRKKA